MAKAGMERDYHAPSAIVPPEALMLRDVEAISHELYLSVRDFCDKADIFRFPQAHLVLSNNISVLAGIKNMQKGLLKKKPTTKERAMLAKTQVIMAGLAKVLKLHKAKEERPHVAGKKRAFCGRNKGAAHEAGTTTLFGALGSIRRSISAQRKARGFEENAEHAKAAAEFERAHDILREGTVTNGKLSGSLPRGIASLVESQLEELMLRTTRNYARALAEPESLHPGLLRGFGDYLIKCGCDAHGFVGKPAKDARADELFVECGACSLKDVSPKTEAGRFLVALEGARVETELLRQGFSSIISGQALRFLESAGKYCEKSGSADDLSKVSEALDTLALVGGPELFAGRSGDLLKIYSAIFKIAGKPMKEKIARRALALCRENGALLSEAEFLKEVGAALGKYAVKRLEEIGMYRDSMELLLSSIDASMPEVEKRRILEEAIETASRDAINSPPDSIAEAISAHGGKHRAELFRKLFSLFIRKGNAKGGNARGLLRAGILSFDSSAGRDSMKRQIESFVSSLPKELLARSLEYSSNPQATPGLSRPERAVLNHAILSRVLSGGGRAGRYQLEYLLGFLAEQYDLAIRSGEPSKKSEIAKEAFGNMLSLALASMGLKEEGVYFDSVRIPPRLFPDKIGKLMREWVMGGGIGSPEAARFFPSWPAFLWGRKILGRQPATIGLLRIFQLPRRRSAGSLS